jgi:hypothetical protein
MADATFERPRRAEKVHGTALVPGYAIDQDSSTNYEFEHRSSRAWRLVAGFVQAFLVVGVVAVALATTVGWI